MRVLATEADFDWQESQHPRAPKGTQKGGKFISAAHAKAIACHDVACKIVSILRKRGDKIHHIDPEIIHTVYDTIEQGLEVTHLKGLALDVYNAFLANPGLIQQIGSAIRDNAAGLLYTVIADERDFGEGAGHPFRGNQWTARGVYKGPTPEGGYFRATVPAHMAFSFASQVAQYPANGDPGLGYFKGVIDSKRHVDALLYRDMKGKVVGILNHYPQDMPPYERKGNFNVMVSPKSRRKGIGAALLREAGKRWDVNLLQQSYTPDGARLVNKVALGQSHDHAFDPNQPRDEHGRWSEDGNMKALKDGLQQIAGIYKQGNNHPDWKYQSIEELVLAESQPFETPSDALPKGVESRKVGLCFMNAYQLVDMHPDKYRYVEGFGSTYGVPLAHSWAIDKDGNVVDPTWIGKGKKYESKNHAYYGVIIPIDAVRKTIFARGKYGVLHNPEKDFPLLKHGLHDGLTKSYDWQEQPRGKTVPGTNDGSFAPAPDAQSLPVSAFPRAKQGTTILEEMSGLDTLQMFTKPDGTLTAERLKLHDAIVAEQLAGHQAQADPVSYLMGGGGASGKTVMQEGLSIPKDHVHVDVDIIRTKLPEWKAELAQAAAEGRKPHYLLGMYTHEESSLISKRVIDGAVSRRYNMLVDGAGDTSIDKVAQNAERYSAGGTRKLIANYATVDYDQAYQRMRDRGDRIGRYIPAAHLREVHAEVARVFPEAAKRGLFNEFTLWDTTSSKALGGGKFSPPVKVASGVGTHMNIHDEAAWGRFIAKGAGIAPRAGEI